MNCFCQRTSFLLLQAVVVQIGYLAYIFLKMNELVSLRKTTDSICCPREKFSFQAKMRIFGKLVSAALNSAASQNL